MANYYEFLFWIWGDKLSRNSSDEASWPIYSPTSICLAFARDRLPFQLVVLLAFFRPWSLDSCHPEVGSCWCRMRIRCILAGLNVTSLFTVLSLLVWAHTSLLLSEMPVWVPDPWFTLHFGSSVRCHSWKSASTFNHPAWLPLEFFSLPRYCLLPTIPTLCSPALN